MDEGNHILDNFPPFLRKTIQELFIGSRKIGLDAITIGDIVPMRFNQSIDDTDMYSYHFTLKIPYAGKRLTWEVIFDSEDYTFAPDFHFNDDHFLACPDIGLVVQHIPSLVEWNVKDAKCLVSVLQEFLKLYGRTQLERLHSDNVYSRIFDEYTLLTGENGVSPDNIEIIVDPTSVHFLIAFKIDFSDLPDYIQPTTATTTTNINAKPKCRLLKPGEDLSNLKVSFIKLDGSRVNTDLYLSPRLDQVIGPIKSLHIPSYTKETSLVEYVPLVRDLVDSCVKDVRYHYKSKKQYINAIAAQHSFSMIECDVKTFNKAVLLFAVDDFHCLVHIDIGKNFPKEKPTVTLYSVYCLNNTKKGPCSRSFDGFPFSQKWRPQTMVEKLTSKLADAVRKYKAHVH